MRLLGKEILERKVFNEQLELLVLFDGAIQLLQNELEHELLLDVVRSFENDLLVQLQSELPGELGVLQDEEAELVVDSEVPDRLLLGVLHYFPYHVPVDLQGDEVDRILLHYKIPQINVLEDDLRKEAVLFLSALGVKEMKVGAAEWRSIHIGTSKEA